MKLYRRIIRPFEVVVAWTACALFGHRVRVYGWHASATTLDLPDGAPVTIWPGGYELSPCLRCGRSA